MKKLIFGLVATLFTTIHINAQKLPQLCPFGQHPVFSYEFNCLRLHRASTHCTSKFSICSDGYWTMECVGNEKAKLSHYDGEKGTAVVIAEIFSEAKTATLHFPIGIKSSPEFASEDFKNFGFDQDYSLSKDIIIAKGEYIPTFTSEEILINVILK